LLDQSSALNMSNVESPTWILDSGLRGRRVRSAQNIRSGKHHSPNLSTTVQKKLEVRAAKSVITKTCRRSMSCGLTRLVTSRVNVG
jgi:hypothetical protein